ncbi:uncharacterized protein LOC134825283 [Bolinopsis microptera]|uniref:uncharacterized protein LOC134825283 n=1 Tax=Bolinopsis microptera TaxID=2820187 RepID=UPI003078B5D7
MGWKTTSLLVLVVVAVSSQYDLEKRSTFGGVPIEMEAVERCHQSRRNGLKKCDEYSNLSLRAIREAREVRETRRQKRQVPQDETGGDSEKPKPDCNLYKDTDWYAICTECEAGTKTGEECKTLPKPEDLIDFPEIDKTKCLDIEWGTGREHTADDNFGNCIETKTDDTHRYITSNNVPDFYVNSYCPIGLGKGYCVQQEIDAGTCYFTGLTCGAKDNGAGTNDYGDVWVPQEDSYKIKLEGDPTLADRPGDMYDATKVGGAKTNGAAQGVAINGIAIQGPNDAGDVSIDEAGFQLPCGGHVTPPMGNSETTGKVPAGPPKYHFHKSPECLSPFTDASKGLAAGGEPLKHGKLMGWAMDGFGIYTYQDVAGVAPVVDECGGHFGPTDTGEVKYHYHSRAIVPYHMACQGPALGQCDGTQSGTNYCHPGCGAQVCVQPGTSETKLKEYIGKFNDTWLEKYTTNPYNGDSALHLEAMTVILAITLNLVV